MKLFTHTLLFSTILSFPSILFGQEANRFSLELQGGVSRPMGQLTPGYWSALSAPYHARLGFRFMATPSFGLRMSIARDQWTGKRKGFEFSTSANVVDLEGVLNLGRICKFEEFSKKLGLMVHAGAGGGMMMGADAANKKLVDRVGVFTGGITPMFKVSESLSILADLSMYANVRQQNTLDFRSKVVTQGFDGHYSNLSIGISYTFGSYEQNMDWRYEEDDSNKELVDSLATVIGELKTASEEQKEQLDKIKKDLKDSDKDGVPNYLDLEPKSEPNATVDSKGRTITAPVEVKEEPKPAVDNNQIKVEDLMGDSVVGQKLFYTVQIGVYSKLVEESFFKSLHPIYVLRNENKTNRYFHGIFHSVEEATPTMKDARERGIEDAYITAYYKGKRISLKEAEAILKKEGPSVLREKK